MGMKFTVKNWGFSEKGEVFRDLWLEIGVLVEK